MLNRFGCFAIVGLLLIGGCGAKKEIKKVSLQPVSGKVMFNGKAPDRALLTFHPSKPIDEPNKRSIVPTARVNADGSFKVGFYEAADGAPAGEYSITIVWPAFRVEAGEEIEGEDRLQRRYADKQRPAAKFTVKDGENKIPDINLR